MVGASANFLGALDLIRKYSASAATVVIQGETGTGKELAARAIHYGGPRRDLAFIPVNCGALPDSLVESELFGHVRGAFTDAREARPGLIHQARGGTLFLDELEVMTPRAQVVLLRFLQDQEYRPVGGAIVENANVRVIGATNADLPLLVKRGLFRSDLMFRLNVLPLRLPPLRERLGDAVLLAEVFVDRLNRQSELLPRNLHTDSVSALNAYSWPGNVRELENLIQREFVLAAGRQDILIRTIDDGDASGASPGSSMSVACEAFNLAKARAIATFEKAYLVALLSKTAGNITLASRLSGKDRSDIAKLLKKHHLERHDFLDLR